MQESGANSEADARIKAFNTAVYFRPAKDSGMYQLDGVVDVLPGDELVRLVDVRGFSEVGESQSREILDAIHASRSQ